MMRAHSLRSDPAVDRAVEFLLEMQRSDGLWYDFYTLAGQSNDWVSGVVACALAGRAPRASTAAADRAVMALVKRQRANGGWSYNQKVPTDCDSTAWVMRALLRCRSSKPSALIRATRYILRHQDAEGGGFSTYAPSDRIERFIGVQPDQLQGWLSPHLGVTCTSVQALLEAGGDHRAPRIASALRHIEAQRERGGLWTCYWWRGHGYATYHALRTLGIGNALDSAKRAEVAKAIIERQEMDGTWRIEGRDSAFETAMMLNAAELIAHMEPVLTAPMQKARSALLALQKQDGSFAPAPILRIPPPSVPDPNLVADWRTDQEGTGVMVCDSERVFTTACVVDALAREGL